MRIIPKRESASSSSPDPTDNDAYDFVMVPAHLTMDAAENRKTRAAQGLRGQVSGVGGRRHTVSGPTPVGQVPNIRPNNLPMQIGPTSEPIPVPTQKAAYQQIQQSLVRSRSRSGDSVSGMSGISSASGGSTLGPLPEERIAHHQHGSRPDQSPGELRKQARVSPMLSPRSPSNETTKTRRVSAPPIPDICQLSPPSVQFTLGTPPTNAGFGHRRRTSSSSSCGTPPPAVQWQISPNSPAGGGQVFGAKVVTPSMITSPSRRANIPPAVGSIPALSPIQGSPNKTCGAGEALMGGVPSENKALMQWDSGTLGSRAFTVPDNLSSTAPLGGEPIRRRSSEMQLVSGRNVVLNYGAFDRASKTFFKLTS
jgi:hypothetical protein